MFNNIYSFYYDWWKNIDKLIFFLIISLFSLGLFFSLVSTSIIASDKLNTNSYHFFLKHLFFIILSVGIFSFLSFMDKNKLFKICYYLFFISFLLLFLVPFLGVEVKGSKRWIDIGILPRLQPVEILKPFLVIILGILLSLENIKKLYIKYLYSFFIIIPILTLLVLQPDIGQTILIIMVWLTLVFISGVNLILFFSLISLFSAILGYLIIFIPKFEYIKSRILSFFDPSSGDSYQSEKASEAIINGGLFGQGIGEGTLNTKVPEAHTDYIISVISEEFGVIIVILIMIIFLVLTFKIMKKIDEETDNKVKITLLGCTSLIILQSFIHIGVNIAILPTTGMTLPFLSYGGSSTVSTAIISGIILNLTKRKIKY